MSNSVIRAIDSELRSIEQRVAELVTKQSGQLSNEELIKISALAQESGEKHAALATAKYEYEIKKSAVDALARELSEARDARDRAARTVDSAERRLKKIDPQLITLRAKQARVMQQRGLSMHENNELITLRAKQAQLTQSRQMLS